MALAQSQPPLASLRELTRLSALAKGCARSSSKFEFRKLISSYHSIKVTTPTEKEVVVQRDMLRRLEYRGGVELKALAMRLKEGDASALRQLVLKARPAPSALSWKFIVRLENGIPEGVNIPPQNETGQDAGALLAQGFFLYDRNRFADAAKCFDSILRLFPNCDDAAWAKAMTLREEAITKAGGAVDIAFKQVQKSTELLEQLVKRNPLCVQAFFQLGITHRAFRSNTEAIHDFEQAIKIAPDFAAAHYALGLTWKDTKNYSNAAKCFRAALSLESDTETARDATEQLALVEKGLKEGGKRAFKEYALKQQGISLRHPDDWLVMTPEEMLKRAKGNTVLTPECVLVIANPDNWAQNVTIQVREAKGYDVIPPKELEALSQNLTQQMTSHVDGFKDLGHQIIEVSAVPALEMDSLSSAWGKKHQQRSVLFVKQERLYTITCSSTESEFADANAKAFSVIIDGLKVQSSSGQASRSSFGKSSIDKPDPIGLPLMILLGICVVVGLGVARRSGNAT